MLGERQSGEIANVGFDLYNQMLKEAVRALKRGETPDVEHPFASVAEINLHAPALLPSDYVPDVNQRLGFYKELAAAETPDAIDAVVENLADRYGEIPPQAKTLIDEHRIRLLCEKLGIRKVDASEKVIYLTVADKPKFEPLKFIDLMQSRRDMRMTGPNRVQIAQSTGNVESRIAAVKGILGKLE